MSRLARNWIAVCLSYALLLVLVCPEIPTPIYLAKDTAAGKHLQGVAAAVVAVLDTAATVLLEDSPVRQDRRTSGEAAVWLCGQLRC